MVSEGGGADEEARAMEEWLPHRCLAICIRKKEEVPCLPDHCCGLLGDSELKDSIRMSIMDVPTDSCFEHLVPSWLC